MTDSVPVKGNALTVGPA